MSLHYISGGTGPRPTYFAHQGSEGTCVLCAINNAEGRPTYTAAYFGEVENQWRQSTGQAPRVALEWWQPEQIYDFISGESDNLVRVPQENVLGPPDFHIYDNETYLIWTGYGSESHLTAIRDGWWLDSRRTEPLELGQRMPSGRRQIASIPAEKVRGLWRVIHPSTSITPPVRVLTIRTYVNPADVSTEEEGEGADTEPEGADTEPESE